MLKDGFARLPAGDGTLSRRVLKRCRDEGLAFETETEFVKIGRNQYGTKVTGYLVPKTILDEEHARRATELTHIEEREAVERAKRRAAVRQRQIAEVAAKFPQLSLEAVEGLVDTQRSIYSEDEVGYQFGVGTKSYWNQLGFAVTEEPTGFLVRGKRILDTYSSRHLEPRSSRTTVERLKLMWLKKYRAEQLVLAQALRIANRLQKVRRVPDFYGLKDQWIRLNQENLLEGKEARVEKKSCWSCGGTGQYGGNFVRDDMDDHDDDSFDNDCWKCHGTGVFSSRTLYERRFLIDGTQFRFHSYERPRTVVSTSGEDVGTTFGRPFEKDELPVPPQNVIIGLIKEMLPTLFPEMNNPVSCFASAERSQPASSRCLRIDDRVRKSRCVSLLHETCAAK